jgi:hypothetical protein
MRISTSTQTRFQDPETAPRRRRGVFDVLIAAALIALGIPLAMSLLFLSSASRW